MAKKTPFKPVVVYDTMGFVRQFFIAADADGEDAVLLMSDTTRPGIYTREIVLGQIGARYGVSEKDPHDLAHKYKQRAMTYGATPEAIRLLGRFCPTTKQEEDTMAKTPLKADKEGLKTAAKAAPVGGGKAAAAPKKTGNTEALAKAHEASAAKKAELMKDKRKLVLTDKGKEKVKAGDASKGSIANLVAMRDAKTVGAAITAGLTMADINYAVKNATIEAI